MKIDACATVIGARLTGVDLNERLTPTTITAIEDALERYGVLIFPAQSLSPVAQIEFSRCFGTLFNQSTVHGYHADHPDIFVIGNTGKVPVSFAPGKNNTDLEWHTDHIQYSTVARATILHALEVPDEGSDTLFACMYHAYESLSQDQQTKLDSLQGAHSIAGLHRYLTEQGLQDSFTPRTHYDVVHWPLVRVHPRSGRKALYFAAKVTVGIKGMPESDALGLIADLTAHATGEQFQYRHCWSVGDVVMWDNRRVQHAGTPFDMTRYRRRLHRTMLREDHGVNGAQ